MREIVYAGGSFVTSDEIALALLEYAAALANADRAATVRVPGVGLPAGGTDVAVLVGPASQVMAEPAEWAGSDPDGTVFLEQVERRMRALLRTAIYPDGESAVAWDV